MKNNKEVIRELSKEQAKKLGLGNKTTNVLAFMVARKVRHPEEKMDELAVYAQKQMKKIDPRYTERQKDNFLVELEAELDEVKTENLEDESLIRNGKPIANIVKSMAKNVFDALEKIAEEECWGVIGEKWGSAPFFLDFLSKKY